MIGYDHFSIHECLATCRLALLNTPNPDLDEGDIPLLVLRFWQSGHLTSD